MPLDTPTFSCQNQTNLLQTLYYRKDILGIPNDHNSLPRHVYPEMGKRNPSRIFDADVFQLQRIPIHPASWVSTDQVFRGSEAAVCTQAFFFKLPYYLIRKLKEGRQQKAIRYSIRTIDQLLGGYLLSIVQGQREYLRTIRNQKVKALKDNYQYRCRKCKHIFLSGRVHCRSVTRIVRVKLHPRHSIAFYVDLRDQLR